MPGPVPACRGRNIELGGYQTKTEVEITYPSFSLDQSAERIVHGCLGHLLSGNTTDSGALKSIGNNYSMTGSLPLGR